MWDRGVSVRCMVTWAAWVMTVLVGLVAYLSHDTALLCLTVVLACGGMTLVLLNEHQKTRRVIRVAAREAREAREAAHLTRVL